MNFYISEFICFLLLFAFKHFYNNRKCQGGGVEVGAGFLILLHGKGDAFSYAEYLTPSANVEFLVLAGNSDI